MTQTRMKCGRVKFPGKGLLGVKKSSLWQNLDIFVMFSISFFISGDTASYFLGIIMLIRLLGTLAQTGVGVGM